MDLDSADTATLKRLLESPMFGEPTKEKIRARLRELEPTTPPDDAGRQTVKRAAAHTTGVMTKTEERFVRDFVQPRIDRGQSIGYLHEKIKFRLATGTWYTPDVIELLPDRSWWIHEVKGDKVWDDAAVKFKVAAEQYPWWRWTKTQWTGKAWRVLRDFQAEEFRCRG